jgi:UDP-N-acetylglucosamine 2-epimerase (non-hydrolysing)
MAAIAAYYARIPVIHLEAGLRSGDLYSPYPEEGNRKVTGQLAALHLAPTVSSKANLLAEGVPEDRIVVTGNTVIDALLTVVQRATPFQDARIAAAVDSGDPILLVTSHRRESWETGIAATARAVRELVVRHPSLRVVLPQHGNPLVRAALADELPDDPRVILTEPLDYGQFTHLLDRCTLVLTDSGGVQEEAPSLGKPVLVTRDTTERPEAVTAGVVKLVGTDEARIVREVSLLLEDADAYAAMSSAVNPYGDGLASERSLAAIRAFFGIGSRVMDFGS